MKYVELKDYISILSGFAFKSSLFSKDSTKIPIIRIRDIKRGFSETFYDGDYDGKYIIHIDDMLVGMDGEFNVEYWKGIPSLLNQRVCKIDITDDTKLYKKYLYYIINGKLKEIEDKTAFVTVKHLSINDINKIQIPLPPLEQQKEIAEKLDKADLLRKKDQELLTQYDELAQAIFIDMFGEIEGSSYTIEDCCSDIFLGLTSKVDYVASGGYPLVRARDITKGSLDLTEVKYISEKQHRQLTKYRRTQRGDVLISKSGTLGACVIVDNDVEFSTYESLFTVRTKNNLLLNSFLVGMLRYSSFLDKLIKNKVGAGVAHLNLQMFKNFKFNLPPISLQNQFAEKIKNIEAQKALAEKQAQESEDLFQALLQESFNFN